MWKKIVIILLIIVVLGGGFLLIKNKNSSQTSMADATLVKTAEAKLDSITTTVDADGTAQPRQEEDIKVKINGFVEEVYVEKGDYVNKGDKILKIDEEMLLDSLEDARLSLDEVKRNYQDLLNTYKEQDSLNSLKLEESRRNLEIAQLSLENEKVSLQERKEQAEAKLDDAKDALNKAKEDYENNQYLYENGAVTLKVLKESEDAYNKARDNYNRAKKEYDTLIQDTIPNSLNLAKLKVENAKNQLELLEASIERDRITENDLELARIKVKKVEKEIEEIKRDLEKVVVTSPISGTIVELEANTGDKLLEGVTVAKVADVGDIIVEAMIDEIDINEVKVGQKVKISSDSFEGELEGEVEYIAPVGTKVGNINKFKSEIRLKDTKGLLRPGMFVKAEVITNHRDSVITVTPMAVMGEEEKYVFVVKGGKVEKRSVELGLKNLSKVEISGVKEGERIVIGPFTVMKKLKPGMAVNDIDEVNKKAPGK